MDIHERNARVIEEFRANAGTVGGPWEGATMLLLHTRGAKTLRDTKTLIHHAATAWYSWIRPPRRSRRLISGTIVTGSMWLGLEGTRSSIPR